MSFLERAKRVRIDGEAEARSIADAARRAEAELGLQQARLRETWDPIVRDLLRDVGESEWGADNYGLAAGSGGGGYFWGVHQLIWVCEGLKGKKEIKNPSFLRRLDKRVSQSIGELGYEISLKLSLAEFERIQLNESAEQDELVALSGATWRQGAGFVVRDAHSHNTLKCGLSRPALEAALLFILRKARRRA